VRVTLQPAYILHRRPYRDTSLLLEVFTAEHGRLSLVARGARRRGRGGSNAALLQPFAPLLLSFSGRAEMKTLTAVERAGGPWELPGERLYSGLYLNELLVRLLHRHDPHARLFAAYGEALQGLHAPGPAEDSLRRFEYILLDELGYSFAPGMDAASGTPVRADRRYRYEAGRGLVELTVAEHGPAVAYAGEDLLRIAAGEFSGPARAACKSLFREALAEQLGGQPLRSREFFAVRPRRPAEPTGGG
tara:strand:- start:838 stop:1578 length:741 start_codon:yes stop_codon:yes gene_type:complete